MGSLNPDASTLRPRISALSDAELAQMLTLDSDDYREDALAIAREEAQRRELDVEQLAGTLTPAKSADAVSMQRPSMKFTRYFPVERLAGFGLAGALLATIAIFEVLSSTFDSLHPWVPVVLHGFTILACLEYLRIVASLHAALRVATEGRYPISPRAAVLWHFVPFFNVYWLFGWSVRVGQCAQVNGRGRFVDVYLPGVGYVLAICLGCASLSLRCAMIFGTTWYVQRQLLGSLTHQIEEPTAGWGSHPEA